MFTIAQIKEAHSKVKSGADFPGYVRELQQLGVRNYETWATDGHTDFYGDEGFTASTPQRHETRTIAQNHAPERFANELEKHQQGATSYETFLACCAELGVASWRVAVDGMTCTYFDRAGNEVLAEAIPGD